jgi:hypothetical protein
MASTSPEFGSRKTVLQIEIDRQADGVSGRRPSALIDLLNLPAKAVDDHLLPPLVAPEQGVVLELESGLADDLPELILPFRVASYLFVGGLAHMTENVRREWPVLIVAPRFDLHRQHRQLETARLDVRRLGQIDILLEHHRNERWAALVSLEASPERLLVGREDTRQIGEKRIEIGHGLAVETDVEGNPVAGKKIPIPPSDDPAHRRESDSPQAVVVGELEIVVRLDDLEIPEGHDIEDEDAREQRLHDLDPRGQLALFIEVQELLARWDRGLGAHGSLAATQNTRSPAIPLPRPLCSSSHGPGKRNACPKASDSPSSATGSTSVAATRMPNLGIAWFSMKREPKVPIR